MQMFADNVHKFAVISCDKNVVLVIFVYEDSFNCKDILMSMLLKRKFANYKKNC